MEDCCPICGDDFHNELCHTLECNHKYHYNCLLLTFKNLRCNGCPYCRSKNNYLPIVNGLKKQVVGIHVSKAEELSDENGVMKYNNVPCNALLKRGCNKGKECGKNCKIGYDKCRAHDKTAQELILN
jgi:hypothetical protein